MKEQEIIELILAKDERGMDALLAHHGPLMRYVIAPILPTAEDREETGPSHFLSANTAPGLTADTSARLPFSPPRSLSCGTRPSKEAPSDGCPPTAN